MNRNELRLEAVRILGREATTRWDWGRVAFALGLIQLDLHMLRAPWTEPHRQRLSALETAARKKAAEAQTA